MKRSAALQPLSREHHSALKLAKACERAVLARDEATLALALACRHALQVYADELAAHFLCEERTLLPLLTGTPEQSLAERTLSEHSQLHDLLAGLRRNDAEALHRFGIGLAAHVRFEERELFPALEIKLDERSKTE